MRSAAVMPHHVLLLKNPDESSPDPYQHSLSLTGSTTSIVPTLVHSYVDSDGLSNTIAHGEDYGGVIITSGRAVDAWENATTQLQERGHLHAADLTSSWTSKPFYVVGPKTERQLLNLVSSKYTPGPELVLGAKESGTGELLAKFICVDYPTRPSHDLPLLYLTGDKNAGGVGKGLEGNIGFKMVQVYATSASTTFEEDFERGVREGASQSTPSTVIVFFAPSSAELALPVIRKHFSLSSPSEEKPRAKLVAIGPTTARALAESHNLQVDAVSSKPEPGALADAIQRLSTL
ncbi:uroporphyrinogen-III synthase [Rhizoctonia solani 123E]|uniref:Uroporphyrinogen-III synthase n=1 Tax=Rhizoctonia solani 123E TaxID=1423351 RepID=A0A074RYL4_9AGAM|nr:uroporphyrinogen-III synthase [Rhizoctonia solani 123E]